MGGIGTDTLLPALGTTAEVVAVLRHPEVSSHSCVGCGLPRGRLDLGSAADHPDTLTSRINLCYQEVTRLIPASTWRSGLELPDPLLQSPVIESSTVASLAQHVLGVRGRLPMPRLVGVGCGCHPAAINHQIRRPDRRHDRPLAWDERRAGACDCSFAWPRVTGRRSMESSV